MFNKKNLLKLADYLERLPENYEHFEMRNYLVNGNETAYADYVLHNGGVYTTCGAAACAVGHGPSAGFLFLPEELQEDYSYLADFTRIEFMNPDWGAYMGRVFIDSHTYTEAASFMFGGGWSNYDNTPWGAAARIRMVCDLGPEDAIFDQYYEYDPEVYSEYHKNNRPAPSLIKRVLNFIKG